MTGGRNAKGRGQIEVFFAIGIPDVNAPGAFPDHGPGTVRLDKRDIARLKIAELLQDGSGFRHKNLRFMICDWLTNGPFLKQIINHKYLHSSLFRRPDDFVQLDLEPHRQGIGHDLFSQLAA